MDNLKRLKRIYILSLIIIFIMSELIFNFVSIRFFEKEMTNTIFRQNEKQLSQLYQLIEEVTIETQSPELLNRLYSKIAQKSYNGSESFVCFLDSTGKIIAHGDPNMIGKSMKNAIIQTQANTNPAFFNTGKIINGYTYNKGYNTTEIVTSKFNTNLQLNISIHENKEVVEERLSELRNQFLIIGIILFIILLTTGLYFGNKLITYLITQISDSQKKILNDNEKLLVLNEQLNDYSTIVSHDVASPLAIITMSIDMLKMKLDQKSIELISSYTDKISTAVNSIKDLTQNLLEVSKITETKYNSEPVNLNETINIAKKLYDSETTSIQILHELPTVIGDKHRLEVVFNNLISNGLKYNNSDQKNILFDYEPEQNQICIHDNGIGIPQEDLSKIFSKFFRSSNKGNKSGHGVGLHMVKKIIEKMDGKITVTSKPKEGTTFIIQFKNTSDENRN